MRRYRNPGRRPVGAILVLLLGLLWPAVGHAWWNADWSTRTKINLDTTPVGVGLTEPVGRTAVLVRLHAGNFDFAAAKEDGSDLRFVAGDDATPLRFHIEKFDGLIEQVGLVWVDLPELPAGAVTPIFVYYGNPEAGPAADAKNTYGPEQLLVYHFADAPGTPPQDVTQYAHHATASGGQRDDAGLIGPGLKLDGSAPLVLPAAPTLASTVGQPLTLSLWAKPAPGATTGVLYAAHDSSGSLVVGLDQGIPYVEINGPGGFVRTPAGPALTPDAWHHLAVTVTDRVILYVDGAVVGEAAASLPAIVTAAAVGGEIGLPEGTPARPGFVGQIDELQIAKEARPAGAFRAAALSQGVEQKLLTFEVAESTSAHAGYAGILLRSMTVDGWVVVAICVLLMPLSWWVIGAKTMYINRMARANGAFEDAYADVLEGGGKPHALFTALAEPKDRSLQNSALWRLYDTGARELQLRAENGVERLQLVPEQLTAIRSALDTNLVRESEELNRRLVILTVAISGGPFLGLLGTVVGVMITFAAVAAAGDVNVNAIAPGIAAALVATVAGLAVAIPALFGYNYLLTRIKELNAQLQVFSNELVARMAETFRSQPAARAPQPLAGE